MSKYRRNFLSCGLTTVLLVGGLAARADEGMWLFNAPPRAELQARHNFSPDEAWLGHLMRASVRFGTASASFVSADGLVITNHHVGRSRVQQLSTAQRDLLRDGYYAPTPAEELKCPGTILTVLQSIEDITERVSAAQQELAGQHARYQLLAVGDAFASQIAVLARALFSRPATGRASRDGGEPASESAPSSQATAAAAADRFYQDVEIVRLTASLTRLTERLGYDEDSGRSISVHSVGIAEALRSIYGAEALLAELKNGRR